MSANGRKYADFSLVDRLLLFLLFIAGFPDIIIQISVNDKVDWCTVSISIDGSV